jgi:hypothetical protein
MFPQQNRLPDERQEDDNFSSTTARRLDAGAKAKRHK